MIINSFKIGIEKLRTHGLSDAEIARQLGVSPANLWRKLNINKTLGTEFWLAFLSLLKKYKIKLPT